MFQIQIFTNIIHFNDFTIFDYILFQYFKFPIKFIYFSFKD